MSFFTISHEHAESFSELTEWCKNCPDHAAFRIARLEAMIGNPKYGSFVYDKTISPSTLADCSECGFEKVCAELGASDVAENGNSELVRVCVDCMLKAVSHSGNFAV